jgi:hypothetical protein
LSVESVESVWAALSRPPEGLRAQLHPDSEQVWIALDAADRRHLLVRAAQHQAGERLITTHGLHAETAQISVESGPIDVWADISCTDRSLNRTFMALAADLVSDVVSSRDAMSAVQHTLKAWQWFWGVSPDGLGENAAVGLFGEMWFLDRWAPFPGAVESWHGFDNERHDFSSPRTAVEVKTTRSHVVGPPRHHISTLDQLEAPGAGPLLLFSLQAIAEANAGNTLPGLISRLRGRLKSRPDLAGLLDQGLAEAGWTPAAAAQHPQTYRIAAERLYQVDGEFPRLTRRSFPGGLPNGVDEVGYRLDLATCASWLVATSPDDATDALRALA